MLVRCAFGPMTGRRAGAFATDALRVSVSLLTAARAELLSSLLRLMLDKSKLFAGLLGARASREAHSLKAFEREQVLISLMSQRPRRVL